MSKQPFEEFDQRWSDLPLPDADAAWKDMSALLDKDERRKGPPFLPVFLSGCTGWALLLLVLAGSAVGIYWQLLFPPQEQSALPRNTPRNTHEHTGAPADAGQPSLSSPNNQPDPNTVSPGAGGPARSSSTNEGEPVRSVSPNDNSPHAVVTTSTNTSVPAGASPVRNPNRTTPPGQAPVSSTAAGSKGPKEPTARRRQTPPTATNDLTAKGNPVTATGRVRRSATGKPASGSNQDATKRPDAPPTAGANGKARPARNTGATGSSPALTKDAPQSAPATPVTGIVVPTMDVRRKSPEPVHPAPAVRQADSAVKVAVIMPSAAGDSAAAQAAAEAAKKKARRAPWLSAGAGISQAVPIGGQQASGTGYNGRFNPLSDHVPALWLRAHQGRWFLQGEARFNAPQLVPAFAFAQKTRWDTGAHTVQTDRQQLRKAWYHQFPLTLNYELLPRWSIGAGAQWSVLYRAAGERITLRRDISSTQTAETHNPFQVPGYRDSFLYRSQWQLVLQTEVGWRRWGLGLRYRSDLQPFLRYTQPDGTVSEVSNEAFEATLRFRLWQSKKRK